MIATTITTRYSFLLMLSKKPKLALISCSGRKGKTPAPARFLYTGALFKKSLAFAEREYDHSVILSAKHGLLELDDIVEPYDQPLQRMPRPKREEWAQRVSEQIKSRYDDWSYVYLAGKTYLKGLPPGEDPWKGLDYGFRQQWLIRRLSRPQ